MNAIKETSPLLRCGDVFALLPHFVDVHGDMTLDG
jgi:hypothetical protein